MVQIEAIELQKKRSGKAMYSLDAIPTYNIGVNYTESIKYSNK